MGCLRGSRAKHLCRFPISEVWDYHERIVDAIVDGKAALGKQLLIEHMQLLSKRGISIERVEAERSPPPDCGGFCIWRQRCKRQSAYLSNRKLSGLYAARFLLIGSSQRHVTFYL